SEVPFPGVTYAPLRPPVLDGDEEQPNRPGDRWPIEVDAFARGDDDRKTREDVSDGQPDHDRHENGQVIERGHCGKLFTAARGHPVRDGVRIVRRPQRPEGRIRVRAYENGRPTQVQSPRPAPIRSSVLVQRKNLRLVS